MKFLNTKLYQIFSIMQAKNSGNFVIQIFTKNTKKIQKRLAMLIKICYNLLAH